MSKRTVAVVDADGHVVEPVDMCETYLAPEYKHRRPKLIEDSWGTPRMLIDNMLNQRGPGYDCGNPDGWLVGSGADRLTGASDPHTRIKDMDTDGPIDIAVLFPSLMAVAPALWDSKFQAALCRAYNNWVADLCAAYPDRLKAVIVPPMNEVHAAIAEIHRCRNKSSAFVGIVIPSNIHGKNLGSFRASVKATRLEQAFKSRSSMSCGTRSISKAVSALRTCSWLDSCFGGRDLNSAPRGKEGDPTLTGENS